jgi:hypothetical protein
MYYLVTPTIKFNSDGSSRPRDYVELGGQKRTSTALFLGDGGDARYAFMSYLVDDAPKRSLASQKTYGAMILPPHFT